MKWIDYREALGIGFADNYKAQMFASKVYIIIDRIPNSISFEGISKNYFYTVGEIPSIGAFNRISVKKSILSNNDSVDITSKMVALINAIKKTYDERLGNAIKGFLIEALDDLRIPFDIKEDKDGIFIFPKGGLELDDANVSIPFQWLEQYPTARDAMALALRSYSNHDNPSNTADLFRKALETFVQEFFNSQKSIENMKSEVGDYLKSKNVPAELRGNFETTLQMYTNYMNAYAKHHFDTEESFLEFIMYQTGNIIRFIITI